jgi:hypothetical protein
MHGVFFSQHKAALTISSAFDKQLASSSRGIHSLNWLLGTERGYREGFSPSTPKASRLEEIWIFRQERRSHLPGWLGTGARIIHKSSRHLAA